MTTLKVFAILVLSLPLWGSCGWAQVELDEFPSGTTVMTWRLAGEDIPPEQTMTLRVTREADEFGVQLEVAARGTAEELGLLSFLGLALGIQVPGTEVALSVVSTDLLRPDILEVGEDYQLPGGRVFRVREQVEVAGVLCVVGEYREPDGVEVVE
ncbi:MAG: hypothetical protein R6U88_01710, partial [Candidatus Bipolaricaulota bacterium]